MVSKGRRRFLLASLAVAAGASRSLAFRPGARKDRDPVCREDIRGHVFRGDGPGKPWRWSCEGFSYRRSADGTVTCGICPHRCHLKPGDRSVCRSKVNIGGKLYSLAYGNPCAVHVDPVEKKPLYHFLPGSRAFSIAVAGCNFRCLNCQNWEISQARPRDVEHIELFPAQVVAAAGRSGAASVAYTYSEPISFFEYMLATSRLARAEGIRNLWISNGYINRKPLETLCRFIDAANVNLKAFSNQVYRCLNGGRLNPVLNTFKTLRDHGVHFEITNLVVPGYNDKPDMVKRMCAWILENLGADRPLHLLRFFPRYKLDRLPPTAPATLERLRKVCRDAGLHYVYIGNVPGHPANHTYCPGCGKLVVRRHGFARPEVHLQGGKCVFCGTAVAGVWEKG